MIHIEDTGTHKRSRGSTGWIRTGTRGNSSEDLKKRVISLSEPIIRHIGRGCDTGEIYKVTVPEGKIDGRMSARMGQGESSVEMNYVNGRANGFLGNIPMIILEDDEGKVNYIPSDHYFR